MDEHLSKQPAPHQNVKVALAMVELWNAGQRGSELVEDYCDPAIELRSPFSSVAGEPYRGYDGISKWARDVDDQFSEWRVDVAEARAVGDRVIVVSTIEVRGRVSDLTMSLPAAAIIEFGADRRISRIQIYTDVDEALGIMGLTR